MPLVSVIMPVYNGEKYLAEAIDSILVQTFADFELLIVDDGSTDGSAEIIRAFEAKDCRVRFFQLKNNIGVSDARNLGISAATGDCIAGMDCDDVSLPQRLETQVDFLNANPNIGAVGTCCRVFSHDLARSHFDFVVPQRHAEIALNLFIGAHFVNSTVMFRRQFLTSVGAYQPGQRKAEDIELVSRLLDETPITFANLPDILLHYRRHAKAKGNSPNIERDRRRVWAGMLQRLWGEAPDSTLDRFQSLRKQENLGWVDRRLAKQDLRRLIDALITRGWVEPDDERLLLAEVDRRLEQASPRLWQQFHHWRRHRLGF